MIRSIFLSPIRLLGNKTAVEAGGIGQFVLFGIEKGLEVHFLLTFIS